ncbi:Maltose-binding periplasmic proteins/domains [uncultured Clostridium sp.]|nr:Maltose-binding periplasmic proteins/domains [uncultured Clostridium sp.]
MKKRWISACCSLLLTLTLVPLYGCGGESGGLPQQAAVQMDMTPTDELNIDVLSVLDEYSYQVTAVNYFKKLYPDVKVNVTEVTDGWAAYNARLLPQLMAGKGPDVVMADRDCIADIYKVMDSGMFLDISAAYDEDEFFQSEEFSQPVLEAGVYKGHRYVVPYSFTVPVLVGGEQRLSSIGFNMDNVVDLPSLFDEAAKALPQAQQDPNFKNVFGTNLYDRYFSFYSGLQLIDWDNNKVLPDPEGFKRFCESYKPLAKADGMLDGVECHATEVADPFGFKSLLLNQAELLMINFGYMQPYAAVKDVDTPILEPMPNAQGQVQACVTDVAAIKASSPNHYNAYNFIKCLLSEPVQRDLLNKNYLVKRPVNTEIQTKYAYYNNNIPTTSYSNLPEGFKMGSVMQEDIEKFSGIDAQIETATLWNDTLFDLFKECMLPYFNNQKSYDECYNMLRQKLELYISE